MTDIKVPAVGESISEVTLTKWVKQTGTYVERDEVIAELESEKATFELNAVEAGVLETKVQEGDTVKIGVVVAVIDEKAAKPAGSAPAGGAPAAASKAPAAPVAASAPAATTAAPAAVAVGKGVLEMKVPTVGESISEVTLVKWVAAEGALVQRDEVICELESEKATFELNAEESGKLTQVGKEGDVLKIGDIVARIDTDVAVPAKGAAAPAIAVTPPPAAAAPVAAQANGAAHADAGKATPVAAAIMADKKVSAATVTPSGFQGRILKQDVLEALNNPGRSQAPYRVPGTSGKKK